MKRYLITGALAFALCTLFNSCKETTEFDGNNIVEAKMDAFDKMFVETYGEIAPGHDWGFGPTSAARTRGIFANANQWSDNYVVPIDPEVNVFPETENSEISIVTAYFTNNSFSDDTEAHECGPNFFVYQISSTDYGKEHMDNLHCGASSTSTLEHLYNFNAGTCSDNGHHGKSMFVLDGSSKYWTYESSLGTKHTFDHFHCVDGATIDERLSGFYYIGFDFESAGGAENQIVSTDGFYNDWIIRISKAESKNGGDTPVVPQVMVVTSTTTSSSEYKVYKSVKVTDIGRVMAEDLGSSNKNDMDYNDVVFEARIIQDYYEVEMTIDGTTTTQTSGGYTINGTSYTAGYSNPRSNIKLLAAGGTIPIQVAGINVHDAFGNVAKTTMINTYNPEMTNGMYVTLPPKDLMNSNSYDFPYTNIDAIPIAAEYANGVIDIKNEQGKVPHKIRVPVTAPWPIERVEMNTAYNNTFGHGLAGSTGGGYVQNPSIEFWKSAVEGKVKNLTGFNTPEGTEIVAREEIASEEITGGTSYTYSYQDPEHSTLSNAESGWTTVWVRTQNDPGYLYKDATEHGVYVSGNLLNSVNVGTKVRIYGVSKSGWNINSTMGYANSFSDDQKGYVEFELQNTNIKDWGLTINGNLFTVVRVDIKPAETQPSQPEEQEHVEATPGNTETDLLNTTGGVDFGYSYAQKYETSVLGNIGNGTVIRVYGWPTSDNYAVYVKDGYNGNLLTDLGATETSNVTYENNGYKEYILNGATVRNIKQSGGIYIAGNNFHLTYVTIDNSNVTEDYVVLWGPNSTGVALGWNSAVEIAASQFKDAATTSKLRFFGSYTKTSEWQIFLRDLYDNKYQENAAVLEANSEIDSKGYADFTLGDKVYTMQNNGLRIYGDGFTLTEVRLIP